MFTHLWLVINPSPPLSTHSQGRWWATSGGSGNAIGKVRTGRTRCWERQVRQGSVSDAIRECGLLQRLD